MVSFSVKKVKSVTGDLGELLQKKRQEAGFSLHQLSRRTLIAERYLEAIECEEWNRLPGEVYIKNFLKRYAFEVGLDPIRVENSYKRFGGWENNLSVKSLQKTLPLSSTHFMILPKYIRNFFIGCVLCILFGYLGWQAKMYFTPPELNIYTPVDNLITSEPNVLLQGSTDPEIEVKVNDVLISVNEGNFEEELDLQPGLNILKVTATKKHGPTNEVYRRVMWRTDEISNN